MKKPGMVIWKAVPLLFKPVAEMEATVPVVTLLARRAKEAVALVDKLVVASTMNKGPAAVVVPIEKYLRLVMFWLLPETRPCRV